MYFTLSSGRPFTPFNIQPIHRRHSLRVFVHGAGDSGDPKPNRNFVNNLRSQITIVIIITSSSM